MFRSSLRLLVLALAACAAPGASAAVSAEAPAHAVAAKCCTVTYNAAGTHFQVTGTVAYRGKPVLFSFHGPCASPAGPGLAFVKSRWIAVADVVAGYHAIDIVQLVDGKVVTTKSPRFYVKGKAQLRKPSATITAGPGGVVSTTSVLFKYRVANTARVTCRLDTRPWQACGSLNWVRYEQLAPGPHVFAVRAYALAGNAFHEARRSFVLSAPPPG